MFSWFGSFEKRVMHLIISLVMPKGNWNGCYSSKQISTSSVTQENQLFHMSGIILWYANVAILYKPDLCYFTPQNTVMQLLKEFRLDIFLFSVFFKFSYSQNVSQTAYTKLARAELMPAVGPFTWIFPQFLHFRLIDICSNDFGSFFSKSLENTREVSI